MSAGYKLFTTTCIALHCSAIETITSTHDIDQSTDEIGKGNNSKFEIRRTDKTRRGHRLQTTYFSCDIRPRYDSKR